MQKWNGSLLRKFDDTVDGNASVGTAIVVRNTSDNSLAVIYSVDDTNSVQKNNPFVTDDFGRYSFYAPNGKYTIEFGDGSDSIDITLVDNFDLTGYDHNDFGGRNAVGAHDASAISRGSSDVDADLTTIEQSAGLKLEVKNAAQWADVLLGGGTVSIACGGDSTMFGSTVGDLGNQDPNNAPNSLKVALSLLYPSYTSTPLNFAISGSTLNGFINGTDGSGSTFEAKLQSGGLAANYDIIYCNHGINDSQLGDSIETYRNNLLVFVNLCRTYGKTPILVTPNPNPPINIIDSNKSKRLGEFVECMRYVARLTNCDMVDQFYFFSKTASMISFQDIVPDGAHLTSRAYLQAGFNLAIPLVTSGEIYNYNDVAGLTNSTFNDNGDVNRQVRDESSRCGPTLIFDENGASLRGLNMPFIMHKPSEYITANHASWASGTRLITKINNEPATKSVNLFRNFGDSTMVDWDALTDVYLPSKIWCGLNIMSLLIDTTYASGNGFGFSGVTLVEKFFSGNVRRDLASPVQSINNFSSVFFDAYLTNAGDKVVFSDINNVSVIEIVKVLDIVKINLLRNGSVVATSDLSVTTVTDGIYPVQLDIEQENINIALSGIGTSIALASPLPAITPTLPSWLRYSVESYN